MTLGSLKLFLDIVFVLAVLVALIDWSLSPQAKARLKDKVQDGWLHLQYVRWSGLASEDARRVVEALVRIFGPPGSRRLLITAGIGGAAVVLVGSLVSIRLQAGGVFDHNWLLGLETLLSGAGAIGALTVTMVLLGALSETERIAQQLLMIAGSVVFSLLLAFMLNVPLAVPLGFVAEIIEDQHRDGDRVRHLPPEERSKIGPEELAYYSAGRAEGNDAVMTTLARLVFAVVFFPILSFVVFLTFMALSKLARPVLQPMTAFVLLRVYESHRGVLAQIASALALLVGLVRTFLV